MCMLSLEMTEEDRAGCCLVDRLMPNRSCDFSSLITKKLASVLIDYQKVVITSYVNRISFAPYKKDRVSGKESFCTHKHAPACCQKMPLRLP